MYHFTAAALQKLLNGSISPTEVQRIHQHAQECRICSRRLEEWRDDHPVVDQRFPDLARPGEAATTLTAGGMVVIPAAESRNWGPIRRRALLVGGIAMVALAAAVGLLQFRGTESRAERVVLPGSAGEAPRLAPPVPPIDVSRGPETTAAAPPPAPTVEQPIQLPPVSDGFRAITGRDAVSALGGPLRLIGDMSPSHFEFAPSGTVTNAQHNLPVIRVVYFTPKGGRIHLDEQIIPADSSGFRPIDDSALEEGGTVFSSAGERRSATWLDEDGYRLSLSGPLSADALRTLVAQVR